MVEHPVAGPALNIVRRNRRLSMSSATSSRLVLIVSAIALAKRSPTGKTVQLAPQPHSVAAAATGSSCGPWRRRPRIGALSLFPPDSAPRCADGRTAGQQPQETDVEQQRRRTRAKTRQPKRPETYRSTIDARPFTGGGRRTLGHHRDGCCFSRRPRRCWACWAAVPLMCSSI